VFITFTQWILVSIPFGTICVFLAWLALCFIMQPYDVKAIPIVVYDRENRMNKKNITVLVLASLTMIAFSTFEYTLKWLFGDIAMVAMVYIAIMFGSGLLTEVPLPPPLF
jgi:di/tricarboxylate transporter